MKTDKEIFEMINNLENAERNQLLELIYNKYFYNRPSREIINKELNRSVLGEEEV